MKSRNCFIKIAACLLSIILVLGALPLSVFATTVYKYGNNRIAKAIELYDGCPDIVQDFSDKELFFIKNYWRDKGETYDDGFVSNAVKTLEKIRNRSGCTGENLDALVNLKLWLADNSLNTEYGDDYNYTYYNMPWYAEPILDICSNCDGSLGLVASVLSIYVNVCNSSDLSAYYQYNILDKNEKARLQGSVFFSEFGNFVSSSLGGLSGFIADTNKLASIAADIGEKMVSNLSAKISDELENESQLSSISEDLIVSLLGTAFDMGFEELHKWFEEEAILEEVDEYIYEEICENIKNGIITYGPIYARKIINCLEGYTIEFDANGGTGSVPKSLHILTKERWAMGNIGSEIPTREGYTFLGWSATKDNAEYYECISSVNVNNPEFTLTDSSWTYKDYCEYSGGDSSKKTLTLYAQWELKTYMIRFNANGGTGNIPKTIVKTGTNKMGDITRYVPTRNGYVFMGWSATKNSTNYNKCIAYTSGQTQNVKCLSTSDSWTYETYCKNTGGNSSSDTLVLYAQWQKIIMYTK